MVRVTQRCPSLALPAAAPGHSFIIADYSQLELRILVWATQFTSAKWSIFLHFQEKHVLRCVFAWLLLYVYHFEDLMNFGEKNHFKNPLLARPSVLKYSPSMAPKQMFFCFLHWPARTAGGWLKGFSRTPTTPILQERIFLGVDAPRWSHLFIIQWCSVRLEARSPDCFFA